MTVTWSRDTPRQPTRRVDNVVNPFAPHSTRPTKMSYRNSSSNPNPDENPEDEEIDQDVRPSKPQTKPA